MQADLKIGKLGRGLFARENFGKGDVVLSVPLDVCIIRQLDAQDAMACESQEHVADGDSGHKGNENIKLSEPQRKSMLWVVELFLSAELLSKLFVGLIHVQHSALRMHASVVMTHYCQATPVLQCVLKLVDRAAMLTACWPREELAAQACQQHCAPPWHAQT